MNLDGNQASVREACDAGLLAGAVTVVWQHGKLLQVNEITPENKKLFVAATRPVYQQYEASIGKEFLDKAIKELG